MDSDEIGGKNKSFKQIKNIENFFVVADDIEIGFQNKIPLCIWIFLLKQQSNNQKLLKTC